MKTTALLLAFYLAAVIDVITGLNLNLYGFGREPLWFALFVIGFAGLQYRVRQARLGMIALALCCTWLVLYPSKNGFDVVLSPTLTVGVSLWLWRKFTKKQ